MSELCMQLFSKVNAMRLECDRCHLTEVKLVNAASWFTTLYFSAALKSVVWCIFCMLPIVSFLTFFLLISTVLDWLKWCPPLSLCHWGNYFIVPVPVKWPWYIWTKLTVLNHDKTQVLCINLGIFWSEFLYFFLNFNSTLSVGLRHYELWGKY